MKHTRSKEERKQHMQGLRKQWQHAKDLNPEPDDLTQINAKLKDGLPDIEKPTATAETVPAPVAAPHNAENPELPKGAPQPHEAPGKTLDGPKLASTGVKIDPEFCGDHKLVALITRKVPQLRFRNSQTVTTGDVEMSNAAVVDRTEQAVSPRSRRDSHQPGAAEPQRGSGDIRI